MPSRLATFVASLVIDALMTPLLLFRVVSSVILKINHNIDPLYQSNHNNHSGTGTYKYTFV